MVMVAAAAAAIGRVGMSRATVTASLRAALQLAVVSLLITAVLRSWWATAGFIALMLRSRWPPRPAGSAHCALGGR